MLRQQAEESKQNYEKLQAKVKEQRIQIDEKDKRKKEIETKKFEVRLLFPSLVLDGLEKFPRPSKKITGTRVLLSHGTKHCSEVGQALPAQPKYRQKLE